MKRVNNLLVAVALGAAVLAGCKKEDEVPTTPPPPAPVTPPAPTAMDNAKDAATDMGAGIRDAAVGAKDATVDAAAKTGDAVKDAAATTGDKLTGAGQAAKDSATAAATDGDATVTAEVTALMDQATTYIKENKWDLADSTMAKLDGYKDRMPASLKPRYDQVKSLYDSAKAGKSLTLPGMGTK